MEELIKEEMFLQEMQVLLDQYLQITKELKDNLNKIKELSNEPISRSE